MQMISTWIFFLGTGILAQEPIPWMIYVTYGEALHISKTWLSMGL